VIEESAVVHASASVGLGTRIWGLTQVRERAELGRDCTVGRGVYIGVEVRIGDRVKLQNGAQVYEPAVIENGVFIGPAAVLTNDQRPRAVTPDGHLLTAGMWTPRRVLVREGASVGAGAVCVAPVTIGRWAMVGAGAIVVRDVPDFALVVGAPARRVAWVGRAGHRLVQVSAATLECPVTGERYVEEHGILREDESR